MFCSFGGRIHTHWKYQQHTGERILRGAKECLLSVSLHQVAPYPNKSNICDTQHHPVLSPFRKSNASTTQMRFISLTSDLLFSVLGEQKRLYPTHIPINTLERIFLGVSSSLLSLKNPERADIVATAAETQPTTHLMLYRMLCKMKRSKSGSQILAERPRIHESLNECLKLEELENYPTQTLGHHYYRYMSQNGFKASERPPVRFIDFNEELAYVMQRYREIHDFVHVLSGLPPSIAGELAVKIFEFVQTGLPFTLLSYGASAFHLSPEEDILLKKTLLPWALRCGWNSDFYLNVYFEKHLNDNIDDLRKKLKFEVAPQIQTPIMNETEENKT